MSQHFLNLIRQGKTTEIAEAVQASPDVAKARDAQGISALMLAIYSGQTTIRDFLLSGLDELDIFEAAAAGDCESMRKHLVRDALQARAVSPDGWPPLHLAAAFATPDAVTMLLEHGAHVHQYSRNPLRNQALHACVAISRSPEIARLLIESGADVNATQAGGFTALHSAASNGSTDLVALLLEHGALADCACHQGKTPADYARERGHEAIAADLAARSGIAAH
jgi:ankyrin repeat protein